MNNWKSQPFEYEKLKDVNPHEKFFKNIDWKIKVKQTLKLILRIQYVFYINHKNHNVYIRLFSAMHFFN